MNYFRFRPLIIVASVLVVLVAVLTPSEAFVTTAPPTVSKSKPSPTTLPPIIESFIPKITKGKKPIHTKFFAQIPDFGGRGSRITGMKVWKTDLYVATSTSGAFIYKVTATGKVSLWCEVQKIVHAVTGNDVDCTNSQHGGVRGVAFPPDHDKTGLFYVSYLEVAPKNRSKYRYFSPPFDNDVADSIVAEFKYDSVLKKVKPNYMRYVMRISNLDFDHPIKQLEFQGSKLLIGHGDGSRGSVPKQGGMRNNALGKILRIYPKKNGFKPYSIPADNPYIKTGRYRNAIFAVGFRNPHNICSHRHGIFVTDAGRDNVEEVNIIKGGKNYGWQRREGTFVHLKVGGTLIGIRPLPKDDAKFGFTYPNVQVPHFAPKGEKIFGQALAGSCPIDNGSPLQGLFLYANFAEDGQLYYSYTKDMKRAVVEGPPKNLSQATIFVPTIYFDHDNNPKTPPLKLKTLRDVIRNDGKKTSNRVDLRFGRGHLDQIYWSSKVTGRIYVITSSLPWAKK